MASATQAVLQQHLTECRDRFLGLQSLIVRTATGIIALLLAIISYLVANHGLPGIH